ncbi:MAG: GMP synthase (glutamine-hydrolyzing) [Myxococcota bacterium]
MATFRGESIPDDLAGIRGILTLGGEMNLGDPLPWLAAEQALLAKAHRAGIPVLGVCLGSQLLAVALGGEVGPMDSPEVGWAAVSRVAPDPLLDGMPDPMIQLHAHSHAVQRLPPGGVLLLSSAACPVQGWRVGPTTIGLQFHCEWSEALIATQVDDPDGMQRHYASYDRLGVQLAQRIRQHLFE